MSMGATKARPWGLASPPQSFLCDSAVWLSGHRAIRSPAGFNRGQFKMTREKVTGQQCESPP